MDQIVVEGRTAVFTVVAISGTTISYQWYQDGLLFLDRQLTGETSSILTIPNVGKADEGLYFVEVKNAGGKVTSRKARLTVVPNTPPVDINDSYSTKEDVPLTIPAAGILANDVDAEGDALTAQLVSDVSQGSLILNPDGGFTYIPNAKYNGSDSFTYRAKEVGDSPVILEQSVVSRNKIEIKKGQKGAQSFRHGTPGGPAYTISKVILRLSRESTAPNTNLSFDIGTGINSGPIAGSSVAIAPSSITDTSQGSSFQAFEIAFGTPVGPLTAGTTYYLNLESEASNGKRIWSDYDDRNSYTAGTYYKGGSDDYKDILFQIYGTIISGNASGIATVTIDVSPVNDPLRFTSQRMTATGFELHLSGPDSSTYIISASANFMDWTPIFTNFVALGNMTFTDTSATNNRNRFYRAEAR